MDGRGDRVRAAELGGFLVALGGLASIICIVAAPGPPYLLALGLMVLGVAPVMVGFYELGRRTPDSYARIALAVGVAAVGGFVVLMLASALGVVTFDESKPAEGAFAIVAICMVAIGLWLVGAAALAGPWLSTLPRTLGIICGIGWCLASVGLLTQSNTSVLVSIGGIGYQLLSPIWGLSIARRFATVRRSALGQVESSRMASPASDS
jgi:hypothetical protein